jgi:type VI secretion system protein ImpH
MASDHREETDYLIERLRKDPYAFDFFQLLRRWQARHAQRPPIGTAKRPAEENFRLGQNVSLEFAPAAVADAVIEERDGEERLRLLVAFTGLLGPNGALPLSWSEYVHDRVHHVHDETMWRFLNVFQHRSLSLFFRAWALCRPEVDMDQPENARFVGYLRSLIGLGTAELQERGDLPDMAKVYFAGHLVRQQRNAAGLDAILNEYFQVLASVDTLHGRWLRLPADSECRLGRDASTGQLGRNLIVGSSWWDCQFSFRVKLGPLTWKDFQRFLPGSRSLTRVRDWVRLYAGLEYQWDLQLSLRRDEVPGVQLGRVGQLGWTSWLKTLPFGRDADNLVLAFAN